MRNKKKSDHDGSYVSWKDEFHPENAAEASSTDRWGVVWAEATLVKDDDDSTNDENNIDSTQEEEEEVIVEPINEENGKTDDDTSATCRKDTSRCPHHGSPLSVILGSAIVVSSIAGVFAIDLAAAVVYILACGFYQLAKPFDDRGPLALIFYAIFMLIVALLMLVDQILLVLSVAVTELMAGITYLVCCLTGGCADAADWHQHTRRLCHLTRWAFRGFHEGWLPERVFPIIGHHHCGSGNVNQVNDSMAVGEPVQVTSPQHANEQDVIVTVTGVK